MEQWTLGHILQQGFVVIAMGLMLWFVNKERYRAPRQAGSLQHSKVLLLMGILCGVFFYGMLLFTLGVTIFDADVTEGPGWLAELIFFAFGSISVSLVVDYFRGRHFLSGQGISYGSQFGRRQLLAWADVSEVRYSRFNKWFVLVTKDGRKARISVMLQGLPVFANYVLQYVSAEAFEPGMSELLENTTKGKLPSMY